MIRIQCLGIPIQGLEIRIEGLGLRPAGKGCSFAKPSDLSSATMMSALRHVSHSLNS